MVAGPAAHHAVALARRLPRLRVGLHLVLVEGAPTSRPEQIPDLIDSEGRLRRDMMRIAFDIALRADVRRQLRREVAAQFEAYRRTGLVLDHVNAHKHFHVHPVIAREVLAAGRDYGMTALRVPHEPRAIVGHAERAVTSASPLSFGKDEARSVSGQGNPSVLPIGDGERVPSGTPTQNNRTHRVMAPWNALLRSRARRAGLTTPDAVFGLRWTGAMSAERLAALLPLLPNGLVEIYTHPATCDDFAGCAPGYRYADELKALTDPLVVAAIRQSARRIGGYMDMGAADRPFSGTRRPGPEFPLTRE